MKIKDMAQTVILICCLVTIPVFIFAYFLYLKTTLDLSAVFEKSFSAAFGFFGGAATLAAAYIASRLFNDWKDQHNIQILANEAINLIKIIHDDIGLIEDVNVEIRDAIYIKDHNLEVMKNILNLSEKIIDSQNNARFSSFNLFYRLTKNDELKNMIDIHSNKVRNISEKLKEMMRHKYDKEVCCNLIHSNNLIRAQTDNIFDNLRKYILVE